ncbi:type II toxin-antitoxin system Phd/YefM family antitoxin [Tsukamurella soli]|uniref:Antitoxin n=1 Tax=Tsukamurella soli TaxID=644556 RepID=A0ABP8J1Z8_9ACTN
MQAITPTKARSDLYRIIEQVNADHDVVEILSKNGENNAVIMSKTDYDALMETQYLLSSPANAIRLLRSLEATQRGQYATHDLSGLDG